MRILVTGSVGFWGSALVPMLQQEGHVVIGVDIAPENSISNCDYFYQFDLRQLPQNIPELHFDICVHLASAVGGFLFNAKEESLIENEIQIFEGVVSLCKAVKCERIIFTSSINVFENDESYPHARITSVTQKTPYARAKVAVEQSIENNFADFLIVRPTNLFGVGQEKKFQKIGESHVIPDLLYKIKNASNCTLEVLGTGEQTRNFLHVLDASSCLLHLIKNQTSGWLNIRSDIFITITELALALLRATNQSLTLEYRTEFQRFEPSKIQNFSLEPLYQLGWYPQINSIEEGLKKNSRGL